MTVSAEALRCASLGLYDAARKEGIVPGDPLWAWVNSQATALNVMAGMVDEQEARMTAVVSEQEVRMIAVVSDAKEIVGTQVDALRTVLKVAEEHNKRTQIASQHMKLQQETVVSRTVSDLTEQVSAKLSGALVLRQRRYDRTHFWGSIGLVTSLALGLFFGGFALHAYEWRNETGALQRCMKTAVRNSNGVWFCEMRSVEGW